jgi:hypothetical protein
VRHHRNQACGPTNLTVSVSALILAEKIAFFTGETVELHLTSS